jgi:hypothetical protein
MLERNNPAGATSIRPAPSKRSRNKPRNLVAETRKYNFLVLSYARNVPRNDEFVNLALVVMEDGGGGFAGVTAISDWEAVRAFDPNLDQEMAEECLRGIECGILDPRTREATWEVMLSSFSNNLRVSESGSTCLSKRSGKTLMRELAKRFH